MAVIDNFIETERKGGGRLRLRADYITGLMEVEVKEGDKYKKLIRVHLGSNNHIDVEGETLDSMWNKMCQAMGRNLVVVAQTAPGFPGHVAAEPIAVAAEAILTKVTLPKATKAA